MRVLAGNSQPRTTPTPERFTIVNGIPQTIALQYTTGKRVTSRIPGAADQMMYTLSDGRRAYLPLEVGAEIDSMHLAPGQAFQICKHGPRDWDLQLAAQPTQAPTPAPRPSPPPQRPPQPPPPQPPAPQQPPQRMNGAGEDTSAIMVRCYASAIEIATNAMEAARDKGLHITASFEDVRCIAATLLINETGGRK